VKTVRNGIASANCDQTRPAKSSTYERYDLFLQWHRAGSRREANKMKEDAHTSTNRNICRVLLVLGGIVLQTDQSGRASQLHRICICRDIKSNKIDPGHLGFYADPNPNGDLFSFYFADPSGL